MNAILNTIWTTIFALFLVSVLDALGMEKGIGHFITLFCGCCAYIAILYAAQGGKQ